MSQLILQPFFRLSYVTGFSLTSPGIYMYLYEFYNITGIGRELVTGLLGRGARVCLACRDVKKGEEYKGKYDELKTFFIRGIETVQGEVSRVPYF